MSCEHVCCPYSHLRRPSVSFGQCECRCHDGWCEARANHEGECNCPGDYYVWPHHYVYCPKGMAMAAGREP